ncbi:Proteasome formation inhibitor PI31 [Handroanthus impetiginosus]|uniref:Proteasome formation inhibitor PI31 n=1 Tax=Handroanthus impetiginosus TaxID=429701 RepID=A0A2G9GAN2_9LAMI|nr:Proteasome formation inhibitor PI31 [Handroanthus impetiginosus]
MATEQSTMAVIRAARPSFRTLYDKAAFAVHAAFVAAGYVLHATGPSAFADDALSVSYADEVGIDNWNDVEDNYAFVYSNPEKGSKKVMVKCLVMNDKLLVDVLKEGDSKPLHLEVDVGEYVEDSGGTNYGSQFKNLGKLVANVNKEVLEKLDAASAARSSSQPSSSEAGLRADRDRTRIGAENPEDPYISAPTGFIVPPVPGSGGSDLFPGPGAGMYPSRGDLGGGSMLVGPNDPRFFGGGAREPGLRGGPPGVPPGARFDPYGPPGVPGFEPGRFVRYPRRPGGGTHPDLEHFHDDSDFI